MIATAIATKTNNDRDGENKCHNISIDNSEDKNDSDCSGKNDGDRDSNNNNDGKNTKDNRRMLIAVVDCAHNLFRRSEGR